MGYTDEKEYSFDIGGFTGVDQSLDAGAAMGSSPDAENGDTSGGALRPASGWAYDDSVGPAPGAIRSLMRHTGADGGETLVIATDAGLYRWTGEAWVEITGGAALVSKRFSHVNGMAGGRNLLVLANGTDSVLCWDGEGSLEKLAADGPVVEGRPTADREKSLIRLSNHGLAVNTAVAFYADRGTLPAGLAAYDTYFVKAAGADTFTVGTSRTGAAAAQLRGEGTRGWRVARVAWLPDASTDLANKMIVIPGHGLMQNEVVVFDPWTGSLPQGVEANRGYYAYPYDANRFTVTTAPDSLEDKVVFTTAGSGFRVRRDAQADWVTGAPSTSAGTGIVTLTGHGLAENAPIQFEAGAGPVPAPLAPHDGTPGGKYYFAVRVTPNTFRVAEEPGGVPIALTASSSRFIVRASNKNHPKGGSVALHGGRVWCAGDGSRPDSACRSGEDPRCWAAGAGGADEVSDAGGSGGAVTAVASLPGGVTVFRERGLFRVAEGALGQPSVVPAPCAYGTVAPATICRWLGKAYFLSEEGLAEWDGAKCSIAGGGALRAFWSRLNRLALPGACAAAHRGMILAAVPVDGSAANNAVVEYDAGRGTFMIRTGVSVSAWLPGDAGFAGLRFAQGERVCLWGRRGDGSPIDSCGGAPMAMRWATPETDFGLPGAEKTVTGFVATGSGGALTVTAKADGRTAARTVALPGAAGAVKAGLRVRGRRFSFEIAGAGAVELIGLRILYESEGDA